jgi:hypothetical protein
MTIETGKLLDELSVAVHRDAARSRRRRRLVVAAAGVVTALVAGVGIAGTYGDWWTGAEPVVQPRQVDEAMHENDGLIDIDLSKKATVARTDDAALVAVATKSGGFCMSLFLANGRGLGSSCDSTPVTDDGAGSAYMTRADDTHWIAYGRITDGDAAAVDLSGAGLPAHIELERGGFFLFDIPRDRWAALDGTHGDMAIVDSSGRTIRKACIYVGSRPGQATSGGGTLGDAPGTCAGMAPIVPRPEFEKAERLVSITLTRPVGILQAGTTVALWSMPNRGGGTCTFLAPAGEKPTQPGGGQCTGKDSGFWPLPVTAGVSSSLHGDEYVNLATGFVEPGTGVAKVELVGADRTVTAAFGGDAFLAELPPAPKVGMRPGAIPGGPYRVVAYDAAGNEVASEKLPG